MSKKLGIKIIVVITDGTQPVGNGIGPILEAKDCLWVLKNDKKGPKDLRDKSLKLAGMLLEFSGKAKKGKGLEMATKILDSGKAYDAFAAIVKAQGGKVPKQDQLRVCSVCHEYKAKQAGTLICLDNVSISRIARIAGAPKDKDAGVYLHKHCGDKVRKGETIMTIYAHGKTKLGYALEILEELDGIIVK